MFWRRAKPAPQRIDFSGHFERVALAVGQHAVANTYNGTVIQQFAADTAPRPKRRPPPQRRPPRDTVELFGRKAERERIDAALRSPSAIAFHGSTGVGKTVLLKHIARELRTDWPDGVLYANAGAQRLEDVLQWLFTVFWDTGDVVFVPGTLRVGEYLAGVRALVVLDDVEMATADVERLLGGAPSSGFALGGAQPRLPERSYPLGGLDADAARRLFARVLERDPTPAEWPAFDAFIARVDGLAGYVVTGAQLVRDGACGPGDLIEHPGMVLARRRLEALPTDQQQLLGLLAELAPAPVAAARLGPGAEEALERLRADGLVERHSPRYTLAGPVDAELALELPHMGAAELLRRLAADPDRIGADDAASVEAAMAWGQRAGEDEAVLDAAKALAPAMVRSGRTGAWGTVALLGLTAAQHSDRLADKALFLHEQGTRLGVLGARDEAYVALSQARDIRRQLPDEDAAALSEHNLRELFGGTAGPGDQGGGGNGGWRPPRAWLAGLAAIALFAGIAIMAVGRGDDSDDGGSSEALTEPARTTTVEGKKDKTPPTITLVRPLDDDRYVAGTRVLARYRCRDGGRRARVCRGTVPSGAAINTTEGEHSFSVHARDKAGNEADVTVTFRAEKGTVPAPEIVITSPADGDTFESGTRIIAQYRCTNASTCEGDVAVGAPVNGRPGPHDFTVRSTGADGTRAELTVSYTVEAKPPDPLVVSAKAVSDGAEGVPTLEYACSGGTAPVSCTGELDDKPVASGAPLSCGEHSVAVHAADAAEQTKDGMFTISGNDCPGNPE